MALISDKLTFLEISDMPILEKVCISSYLGIFQMTATATAATAATAATSQELSISGKAPGPSRAGIKYPVQESLTSTNLMSIVVWPGEPYRSEGFPERDIWSLRDGPGALPDMDSSWDAVAAAAVSCQNVTLISFSFRA